VEGGGWRVEGGGGRRGEWRMSANVPVVSTEVFMKLLVSYVCTKKGSGYASSFKKFIY
jgi:hypothetical protein